MKYLCFLITYLSISSAAPSLEANSRDHRRIISGDEADIKDFKYMGAILEKGLYQCGAVLIGSDTVVTAAHCVYYPNITDLSVRLGSSRWRSGGQEISVKQVIIHEKYYFKQYPSDFTIDYDIAVLKLNESVNVANAVPIGLAAQDKQYETGTTGVVSGWGVKEDGSYPEALRKVESPVYDHTQCQDAYRFTKKCITNTMICAGYKEGRKGACHGDSGSPYVINDELVGIVSFGQDCNSLEYPQVYTSVPVFHDWIELYA